MNDDALELSESVHLFLLLLRKSKILFKLELQYVRQKTGFLLAAAAAALATLGHKSMKYIGCFILVVPLLLHNKSLGASRYFMSLLRHVTANIRNVSP